MKIRFNGLREVFSFTLRALTVAHDAPVRDTALVSCHL